MAAKVGTSSALFRVGSGLPSKVFLGGVSVQNVPGKPVITVANDGVAGQWSAPASDGGSSILGYRVYLNGSLQLANYNAALFETVDPLTTGQVFEVSAFNAIGEGPKSDPETV